jgi:hypothetical protein
MTTFYPHDERHHADTTTEEAPHRIYWATRPFDALYQKHRTLECRVSRDSFRRRRRDRLTALSFVSDLTFGFDTGSAATLTKLHTVTAAIVVPTLARRLARTRGPGSNRAPACCQIDVISAPGLSDSGGEPDVSGGGFDRVSRPRTYGPETNDWPP